MTLLASLARASGRRRWDLKLDICRSPLFRKACKVERFKRLGRIIERAIGENIGFDALEDAKALAVFLVEAASRGISFECHTGCPLACTDFISSVDGPDRAYRERTEPEFSERYFRDQLHRGCTIDFPGHLNVTGRGFAAVARVTEGRWVACSVLDRIAFGLKLGEELILGTTICNEIRQSREASSSTTSPNIEFMAIMLHPLT